MHASGGLAVFFEVGKGEGGHAGKAEGRRVTEEARAGFGVIGPGFEAGDGGGGE